MSASGIFVSDRVSKNIASGPNVSPEELEMNIRPLHHHDYRDIYQIINPKIIGDLPVIPGFEFSQFSEWLDRHNPANHRFVAESNDRLLGLLILSQNLRPRLQHSGQIALLTTGDPHFLQVQYELLSKALDMADNWLNITRLELEIEINRNDEIDNIIDLGFRPEGTRKQAVYKNGEWLDLLLLSRIKSARGRSQENAIGERVTAQQQFPVSKVHNVRRIEVRPTKITDAEAFHKMLLDPAICRTTLQLPSQEFWQVENRLQESATWLHRFTAVADGEIVGSIAMVQDQSPGKSHTGRLGMKVHRDYWSLGIGTRLVTAVTELADNWLNLTRLELDVNTDNPAGIRLYQKTGFQIEGTKRLHTFGDGRWSDSHFMARLTKR